MSFDPIHRYHSNLEETILTSAASRRTLSAAKTRILSLREFLGVPLGKSTPDNSTLTNTRQRLPPEVFDELFQFVLSIAAAKKLVSGKTVGVDSTTLEANAVDAAELCTSIQAL